MANIVIPPSSPTRNHVSVHGAHQNITPAGSPVRRQGSPMRPAPNGLGELPPLATARSLFTRMESPVREETPILIEDRHSDPFGASHSDMESTYLNDMNESGPRPQFSDPPKFEGYGHRHEDSNATVFQGSGILAYEDDTYSYAENDEQSGLFDDPETEAEDLKSELLSQASGETLSGVYEAPLKAQPRRNKSMARREVKLVRGNLVLDCPVPTKLYQLLPRRDHDEFTYMRYTAATTDPDQFGEAGFNLRPANYARETQLCICITMYNEDEYAFTRTMHAVMLNIKHFCSRNRSRVWGKEGWKKIVVTIVADGRDKVHPGVLNVLSAMGVFQEGVAKNYVNGNEVKAHIFEYTTQVSLDEKLRYCGAEKGIVPVQMIFCLKEKNAKKINSHRWLFNAFCPELNPNVCVLLDVGTKPGPTSLYHLWKAFDADSNIGGACGEICAMLGPGYKHLLNPLVAAQNFEYKMSNILDKPLESTFGYITVLPGALSAYRYIALKNDPKTGKGPLASYFKGELLHGSDADVFTSNMYLAEDRILCWELVAKKGEKWLLKYVKGCTGETDVPDDIPEFISQRRRWLNGALFAAVYAQTHFTQIWETSHSKFRKILLQIEFVYQFIQLIFTFFSLANFFLAFYFVAGSLSGENNGVHPSRAGFFLFLVFKYILICTLAALFIICLGNRPQGSRHLFYICIILLAAVGSYALGCGFYFVARTVQDSGSAQFGNNNFTNILISMVSTYGVYVLMSILYLDPWHMLTSSAQYFILLPSYICTLQIYAFCNTHDVTWGTKGDNTPKMDLGSAVVKAEKGKDVVEIEMPAEQTDIDTTYDEVLVRIRERNLLTKDGTDLKEKEIISERTKVEDYYREFRTRVVLVWMIGNMLLALIMIQVFNLTDTNGNVYLKIILWSVAGLSAFRAIGSFAYLVQFVVKYLSHSKERTMKRRALTGKVAK